MIRFTERIDSRSSDLSRDYEGKTAIFRFAKKWEERFLSGEISDHEFEGEFGEACRTLGFQMDCGQGLSSQYPGCFRIDSKELPATAALIRDVDLLGAAVYSQWRYLTHWTQYVLDEKTRRWFALCLGQMRELTRKS